MKFIALHTKNTAVVYKNTLCSYATVVVLAFIISSVMVPVLLVSLLSPYSGITLTRVLYEQPRVQFKYQHIFVAETAVRRNNNNDDYINENGLIACSTFPNFNARFSEYTKSCSSAKYWTTDLDHDMNSDIAHFELMLDSQPGHIDNFDLMIFFEAKLKHKCELIPPALLSQHLIVPTTAHERTGTIHIKAELQLKQYIEFTCPFPGRNIKTNFRDIIIGTNTTMENDITQYELESLLEQLKANPAYWQLNIENTYFRRDLSKGIRIRLDVDIVQVAARYHLSVWERLGQFWLYFASFFGISFYIMNKIKDFLFGRHIIRSWEIIPWKKLY